MLNYVPQPGIIRIPQWLFREFKILFTVPGSLARSLTSTHTDPTGKMEFVDGAFLDDIPDYDLKAFRLIMQMTLDAHPEPQPKGIYKLESLIDEFIVMMFKDKYDRRTWYFRPECMVLTYYPKSE